MFICHNPRAQRGMSTKMHYPLASALSVQPYAVPAARQRCWGGCRLPPKHTVPVCLGSHGALSLAPAYCQARAEASGAQQWPVPLLHSLSLPLGTHWQMLASKWHRRIF